MVRFLTGGELPDKFKLETGVRQPLLMVRRFLSLVAAYEAGNVVYFPGRFLLLLTPLRMPMPQIMLQKLSKGSNTIASYIANLQWPYAVRGAFNF